MPKNKLKIDLKNRRQRNIVIGASIAVLAVIISLTLFSTLKKDYNTYEGNTPSNINNMGLIAHEDGYAYYTKFDSSFKIYKLNLKNQTEKPVHTANAKYINVYKGDIYYINANNGNILRISANGTDESVLFDGICSHLYVAGEYIYFINGTDGNNIYKMNITDLNPVMIAHASAASIFVYEDYLFYTDYSNDSNIFRLQLSTNEIKNVLNQHTVFYTVTGSKLYYTNINDESYVYSMNLDGTGKEKLEGVKGWFLTSDPESPGFLYFKSVNGNLKRVNLETLNQMTISTDNCSNINIIGKYIFYINQDDEGFYLIDTTNRKNNRLL